MDSVLKCDMMEKIFEAGDPMAQTEFLRGLCPKCGAALDIPTHLKQFSCMYCGARLSPSELRSEQPEPVAVCTDDSLAAAEFYRTNVLSTIAGHEGIEKEVTRSSYSDAFDRYSAACFPIFRQLDLAVSGGAITLQEASEHFLSVLQTRWEQKKSWKQSYQSVQEIDKFVIAIFLIPAIRKMELSISEEFCSVFHSQWMDRYPKNPFFIGSYEELSGGFNKKFLGLCFITTAVCRHSGKADDCAELTAFRGFRDGYLRACPDGPDLIDRYYDIAPGIVLHLELSNDRDRTYAAIRETYLEPCFADIQAGRLKQCKERYTEMICSLEQAYLN